jgi:hypothetical protein
MSIVKSLALFSANLCEKLGVLCDTGYAKGAKMFAKDRKDEY